MNKVRVIWHQFLCAILMVLAWSASGHAAGFQLFEGNGINAANFSAGVAAGLFDASTAAYNPAALTDITQLQWVGAATIIKTHAEFSGAQHWSVVTEPGFEIVSTGRQQGGNLAELPAFHVALPLDERLVIALSVSSPFGLATDYGSSLHPWFFRVTEPGQQSYLTVHDGHPVTRYAATKSELRTIDFSPSFGYQVSDAFSFGAGFHVQYAEATFNAMAGAPTNEIGDYLDTESINNAHDIGFGYHVGLLFKPTEHFRLGFAYLSRVSHHLHGDSTFAGGIAAVINLANTGMNDPFITRRGLTANAVLPDSILAGFHYRASPQFDVLGSLVWTHWHLLKHLTLNGVVGGRLEPNATLEPALTVSSPLAFRNTWRVSAGINYHKNLNWTYRLGLGFDQTPTNATHRSIRIPGGNRFAVATGIRYRYSEKMTIDLGWTHLFIATAAINSHQQTGEQIVRMVGRVFNHANLLGLQFTVNLAA